MSTPVLIVGRKYIAGRLPRMTLDERAMMRTEVIGKESCPPALVMRDTPEVRRALGIALDLLPYIAVEAGEIATHDEWA